MLEAALMRWATKTTEVIQHAEEDQEGLENL